MKQGDEPSKPLLYTLYQVETFHPMSNQRKMETFGNVLGFQTPSRSYTFTMRCAMLPLFNIL
jgi:hypothetical protein